MSVTETPVTPGRVPDRRGVAGLLRSRRARIGGLVLLLAIAVLPAIWLLPYHLAHLQTGWVSSDDRAVTEMRTGDIGHHGVLVGPYSREGWNHPGPALFYLLWPAYELLGHADAALPITALLVNAAAIVGVALVVRRRLGTGAMLWSLLTIGVFLRFLEPGFLRDVWNPYLPLLPFLLMMVLCWTAALGDAWAVPVALGIGSFAVQSHVEYAPATVAAFLIVAVALAVRWRRSELGRNPFTGAVGRRVRRVVAWSAGVLVLFWILPVYQQLTHQPGNLGVLVNYFLHVTPQSTYGEGVRVMLTQSGSLPAYLTGRAPYQPPSYAIPAQLPVWTGLVALLLFAVAVGVAVLRRQTAVLWLAGFTAVTWVAGVASVERVHGPVYAYVVIWTVVPAALLWVTTGAAFLAPAAGRLGAAGEGAAPGRAATAVAGVLVACVAALSVVTTHGTSVGHPGSDPATRPLAAAVAAWMKPKGTNLVRLDFGVTKKPTLVGTTFAGSGMILQMRKAGLDAQGPPLFTPSIGQPRTVRFCQAKWHVVIAFSDGSTYGPAKGDRILARSGDLQVYVGPAPTPHC